MKYDYETEEQFQARLIEAKKQGICVFRDDANREFILDIIDEYMDVVDSFLSEAKENEVESKRKRT